LQVEVLDETDPHPEVEIAVYSNQADTHRGGDFHTLDAQDIEAGTLQLRAERQGSDAGRIYLIQVSSVDADHTVGVDCCTVVVPHSPSKNRSELTAQAIAAEEVCLGSGAVRHH